LRYRLEKTGITFDMKRSYAITFERYQKFVSGAPSMSLTKTNLINSISNHLNLPKRRSAALVESILGDHKDIPDQR